MKQAKFRLSDFDYNLPRELIAQYPCAQREQARLLVVERDKQRIYHRQFNDILDYFSAGDCLVLNNTKVIQARIIGRREKLSAQSGGGAQEVFFLQSLPNNTFEVLAKPAKKLTVGSKILFGKGRSGATVLKDLGMRKVIQFDLNGQSVDFWQKYGQVPLPPYIKRPAEKLDKQRYQTVYANLPGATAAPTAGLHFTQDTLKAIAAKGVKIVFVTLHVNYGTFATVKTEDITKHKMHREYFILSARVRDTVNKTLLQGRKVFAVGTTSMRVLEACAGKHRKGGHTLESGRGWTDLFIYPPYRFKIANYLLTNFHFPKSTLLMLVSAFAGKALLAKAYQEAVQQRYRFFSYGDAMLIV